MPRIKHLSLQQLIRHILSHLGINDLPLGPSLIELYLQCSSELIVFSRALSPTKIIHNSVAHISHNSLSGVIMEGGSASTCPDTILKATQFFPLIRGEILLPKIHLNKG